MSKRRAHYCVRVANSICEKIALGFSLRNALDEVGPLAPSMPVFWRWLDEYPGFLEKYQRARQMQGDVLADEMLDMAKMVIDKPSLASAIRVASDILQWQAGIRDPKYNSKAPPEEKKKHLPVDVLKKEILRLEADLGVKAAPGMDTAKRHKKEEPMEEASPAPFSDENVQAQTEVEDDA